MTPIRILASPSSSSSVRDELRHLYRRRLLLDRLIDSLEHYDRSFDRMPPGRAKSARAGGSYARKLAS